MAVSGCSFVEETIANRTASAATSTAASWTNTPSVTPSSTTTLTPTPTLTPIPSTPQAPHQFVYDPGELSLNTSDGMQVYQLDEWSRWVPIIPDYIGTTLPEGAYISPDEKSNWVLKDGNAEVIYRWDEDQLMWIDLVEELVSLPGFPNWLEIYIDNRYEISEPDAVLAKNRKGEWEIRSQLYTLYELVESGGKHWEETEFAKDHILILATELISKIDPTIYNPHMEDKANGTPVTKADWSWMEVDRKEGLLSLHIWGRYIGGVHHDIFMNGNKIGQAELIAFQRQPGEIFWYLGPFEVFGSKFTGFITNSNDPYETMEVGSLIDNLTEGKQYEMIYLVTVQHCEDLEQIDPHYSIEFARYMYNFSKSRGYTEDTEDWWILSSLTDCFIHKENVPWVEIISSSKELIPPDRLLFYWHGDVHYSR